jgi:polyhydroxyalkanoate synthesis regulator phasin
MRKSVITLVVAGLLAGSVATVALAADQTTTAAAPATSNNSVTTDTTTATDPTQRPNDTVEPSAEDRAAHQARMEEMLASRLDALTTAGTLTATEAQAVKDVLTAALATAMAQTPAEGTRGERPDDVLATAIDTLVTQGTLTAEKAQAVKDALAQGKGGGRGGHGPGGRRPGGFGRERDDQLLSTTLDSLVAQGKLTAEQAQIVKDAMAAAIEAARPADPSTTGTQPNTGTLPSINTPTTTVPTV